MDVGIVLAPAVSPMSKHAYGVAPQEVAGMLGSGLHLRPKDLQMSASFACSHCAVP